MKLISLSAFLLFSIALNAQNSFYDNLVKTIAYCITQEDQLNFIEQKYPSLKTEVNETRSLWNSTLGDAGINLENEAVVILGNKEWSTMKEEFLNQAARVREKNYSKLDAIAFLKHIRDDRCKGKIESPIIEMLLAYKPLFQEKPNLEFTGGYIKPITTTIDNDSKLEIELKIPLTWQAQTTEQASILFTFESSSQNESGAIQINSLSEIMGISNEELSAYSQKELADGLLTDEAFADLSNNILGLVDLKNFQTKRTMINDNYAGIVSFISTVKNKGVSITQHQKMYVVLYKQHMLIFTFLVHKKDLESSESFTKRINNYSPLYQSITNSISINY